MAIEVSRVGSSSIGRRGDVIAEANVAAEPGKLWVGFLTGRGTGESRYMLRADVHSFTDIARAMMHASPEAAIRAFGGALTEGTPEPIAEGRFWTPGTV